MLVIGRKKGEKLNIGDNVTVEVMRVAGNRVTLGITAPGEVRVVRTEIANKPRKGPHGKPANPKRVAA